MAKASGSIDLKSLKIAGANATGYMTDVTSNGVFIHEYDTNGQQPTDTGVNGVHISDEVDIIRNGEVVASYGETTQIGKNDESHTILNGGSFSVSNESKVSVFECSDSGATESVYVTEEISNLFYSESKSYQLKGAIDTQSPIYLLIKFHNDLDILVEAKAEFTKGTSIIRTITSGSKKITAQYDGDMTFTVSGYDTSTGNSIFVRVSGARYLSSMPCPTFRFGTSRGIDAGGFSASLGYCLTASGQYQTVIGKYNLEDTNDEYAFVIGGGNELIPADILNVDWNGNVWHQDDGLHDITSSVTATTGTLVSAKVYKYGRVVQFILHYKNTSSVASASNTFEGTLSVYKPVVGGRGVGYWGNHSMLMTVSTAGAIVVRNAGSTAVTINGDGNVIIGTWIIA